MPTFASKSWLQHSFKLEANQYTRYYLQKVESSRGKFESIRKFFKYLFHILYPLAFSLHFFECLIDKQLESMFKVLCGLFSLLSPKCSPWWIPKVVAIRSQLSRNYLLLNCCQVFTNHLLAFVFPSQYTLECTTKVTSHPSNNCNNK